ncbi:hypothetical protein TorRG33x02_086420, partial [Trema orientale]
RSGRRKRREGGRGGYGEKEEEEVEEKRRMRKREAEQRDKVSLSGLYEQLRETLSVAPCVCYDCI